MLATDHTQASDIMRVWLSSPPSAFSGYSESSRIVRAERALAQDAVVLRFVMAVDVNDEAEAEAEAETETEAEAEMSTTGERADMFGPGWLRGRAASRQEKLTV